MEPQRDADSMRDFAEEVREVMERHEWPFHAFFLPQLIFLAMVRQMASKSR